MKDRITFAAWHPDKGFGRPDEISLREHFDDAKIDVKISNYASRDPRWEVVGVKLIKLSWHGDKFYSDLPPCGECHLQPGEICDICYRRGSVLASLVEDSPHE